MSTKGEATLVPRLTVQKTITIAVWPICETWGREVYLYIKIAIRSILLIETQLIRGFCHHMYYIFRH